MSQFKIEDLNIRVCNKQLFKNFNLVVEKNSVTGLLSPSGSGKTTLLNWISGILSDDFEYSPYENFGKISYVFQEPRLLPDCTVYENILLPLKNICNKKEANETAEKYLQKVCLAHKKNEYPEKLSGGEKQRVSIARAFAFPSDLLLLDEPFQSQDSKLREKLMFLVKELLQEKPRTVVFVSHYREELDFLCDSIITL